MSNVVVDLETVLLQAVHDNNQRQIDAILQGGESHSQVEKFPHKACLHER